MFPVAILIVGNVAWESGLMPCETRYFSSFEQQQSKLIKQNMYGTDDSDWKIDHWSDIASWQGFLCYVYFFGLCFSSHYFEAQEILFKEGLHIHCMNELFLCKTMWKNSKKNLRIAERNQSLRSSSNLIHISPLSCLYLIKAWF